MCRALATSGDGAAAAGSRRRSRRHRQHDAADQVSGGEEGRTGRHAGGTAARLGAAARPAARAEGKRAARASRRRFPGPPHDHHASCRRSKPWARAQVPGPGHLLEAPNGLSAGVDLSLRGVRHRHRDRAAGGSGRAWRERDPPRGVRAARRRAVRLPAESSASGLPAVARRRSESKAVAGCAAPHISCGATTSKRGAGPWSARSPAARFRCVAHARKTWKWSPAC